MSSSTPGYWFTSAVFEAEPGEDEHTNPRMYGRQPARWLRDGLVGLGYCPEEVFGEDWGWCVMCQREPYELWVGCVNLSDRDFAQEGDPPPARSELLWNVVPFAEVPLLRYAFRRKPDIAAGLARLDSDLRVLLKAEPWIQIRDPKVSDTWYGPAGTGRAASTR